MELAQNSPGFLSQFFQTLREAMKSLTVGI